MENQCQSTIYKGVISLGNISWENCIVSALILYIYLPVLWIFYHKFIYISAICLTTYEKSVLKNIFKRVMPLWYEIVLDLIFKNFIFSIFQYLKIFTDHSTKKFESFEKWQFHVDSFLYFFPEEYKRSLNDI